MAPLTSGHRLGHLFRPGTARAVEPSWEKDAGCGAIALILSAVWHQAFSIHRDRFVSGAATTGPLQG
jgi:hypothetical protein